MSNYYSTPVPGIGSSFHNLITDEAQFLANRINQAELQTIVDRIGDFEARIVAPGVTDMLGMAIYVVVIILLAAAQAISIVVIAYGFIASAVCVLVGPIFVPFFIVPKLWSGCSGAGSRCFLQYAFYEVIAAAVSLYHRQPYYWCPHPSGDWHHLDPAAHRLVSGPAHHLYRLHLCLAERSPVVDQPECSVAPPGGVPPRFCEAVPAAAPWPLPGSC